MVVSDLVGHVMMRVTFLKGSVMYLVFFFSFVFLLMIHMINLSTPTKIMDENQLNGFVNLLEIGQDQD